MRSEMSELDERSYRALLHCAVSALRRDPASSLSPATLVHEAWLRLAATPLLATTSREHFRAIAARSMRRILIDLARRRGALRRGGPHHLTVTFDQEVVGSSQSNETILDIDRVLTELGSQKPRLESIAELYIFGGCRGAEVAHALGVSEATIDRDVRFVRAWLRCRFAETVA